MKLHYLHTKNTKLTTFELQYTTTIDHNLLSHVCYFSICIRTLRTSLVFHNVPNLFLVFGDGDGGSMGVSEDSEGALSRTELQPLWEDILTAYGD